MRCLACYILFYLGDHTDREISLSTTATTARPLPRRRPHAVEMTQTLVNQVGPYLHSDLPNALGRNKDFWYDCSIHIRDGLIQLMDLAYRENKHSCCAALEPERAGEWIALAERFLLQCLPTRLVVGFHGRLDLTLGVFEGKFQLKTNILQQTRYDWSHLNGRP